MLLLWKNSPSTNANKHMKIDRISYGKSFENAAGVWEKIGLEATLEPGETVEQAYDKAKEIIDGWHTAANRLPEVQVSRMQKDPVLESIEACTDLSTLRSYQFIAKQDERTVSAYNKKLEELQTKK